MNTAGPGGDGAPTANDVRVAEPPAESEETVEDRRRQALARVNDPKLVKNLISGTISVRGSDGRKHPTMDGQYHIIIKAKNHNGKATSWHRGRVSVTEPGDYVPKLGTGTGFRKLQPRDVVVEWGKWTKVVIELERQK